MCDVIVGCPLCGNKLTDQQERSCASKSNPIADSADLAYSCPCGAIVKLSATRSKGGSFA